MKTIREMIWYFLADSKVNQYIAEYSVKIYQKWDLALNLFLAFTTSASIGAWVIWEKYNIFWAVIIGISQVLTVGKPYFLFPKYIKTFNEKGIYWQQLSIELEKLWYDVNFNKLSDLDASTKYFDLKTKSSTFDRFPDDIIFFDYDKSQIIAEEKCNNHLEKI